MVDLAVQVGDSLCCFGLADGAVSVHQQLDGGFEPDRIGHGDLGDHLFT
ncbi:MAG: hypothetical protein R2710_08470 [Acidimicrobiales bacterium]